MGRLGVLVLLATTSLLSCANEQNRDAATRGDAAPHRRTARDAMVREEPTLDASVDSMVREPTGLDASERGDRAVDASDARTDAARDTSDAHLDAAGSNRDGAQADAALPDDADGGVPGDAATAAPTRWAPPPGALPKTINYIYIESDPGDWVLRGHSYLYTQANSVIGLRPNQQGTVQFDVSGDQSWTGSFQPTADAAPLVAGYYPDSHRYPFYKPGIAWTGEGAACNTINGWLSIDHVSYVANALTEIDLRFEQHCDDDVPGLRGAIHWRSDDRTAPMGPGEPSPARPVAARSRNDPSQWQLHLHAVESRHSGDPRRSGGRDSGVDLHEQPGRAHHDPRPNRKSE
ncbi:MAG TPA: hypothetical protein VJV78_33570 [Polyangiales bacterium]|nr:hypothetical protein [Polyangiales bacterium]